MFVRLTVPTYWTGDPIQSGDWVKVVVPTYGGVWHHGIVRRVYWNGYSFAVEVIHNVKDGGVTLSDWSDFQGNGIVHLYRRASSAEHARMVVARAEAQIGKPYF